MADAALLDAVACQAASLNLNAAALQESLGVQQLVQKLVSLYDAHICKHWLPEASRLLQPKLEHWYHQKSLFSMPPEGL